MTLTMVLLSINSSYDLIGAIRSFIYLLIISNDC